jgi:hypothetical protein
LQSTRLNSSLAGVLPEAAGPDILSGGCELNRIILARRYVNDLKSGKRGVARGEEKRNVS